MSDDHYGQKGLSKLQGQHAGHSFQVKQHLARHRTMMPVQIVAVHGGGTAGPPTVDVMPLVNQIDGVGNKQEHDVVYGIPCPRQGNASYQIIADPKVGDIGHMSIADRDISTVKSTKKKANPGSYRRGHLSDGIYHGGPFTTSGSASQYVMMDDNGVTLLDKNGNKLEMKGGGMTITAATVTITGNLTVGGDVVATSSMTSFATHVHTGVSPGGGDSGPPLAGS